MVLKIMETDSSISGTGISTITSMVVVEVVNKMIRWKMEVLEEVLLLALFQVVEVVQLIKVMMVVQIHTNSTLVGWWWRCWCCRFKWCNGTGGNGGSAVASTITGSSVTRAGGGGGSIYGTCSTPGGQVEVEQVE
jgi:hypothetical protein